MKIAQSSVANQLIQQLRKIIHLLSPEQDSIRPSCSGNSTDDRTTNRQYATLPLLQPLHDGDSHKQEITAKSAT